MRAFIFRKSKQTFRCIITLFGSILLSANSLAQLPDADSQIIYMVSGTYIFNFDPALPIQSGLNPKMNNISLPDGAKSCLAVAKKPKSNSVALTFYTIVGDMYYYHDGNSWVNTTHHAGDQSAANIGAGGDYIYNLMLNGGQVFKYDGKTNEKLLGKVNFAPGGPVDVIGDNEGNFYVLKTSNPQAMHVYNNEGVIIQSFGMTGMPYVNNGGGFAIVNQKVYVVNTTGFYIGNISGNIIDFKLSENPLPLLQVQDYGSASFNNVLMLASSETNK